VRGGAGTGWVLGMLPLEAQVSAAPEPWWQALVETIARWTDEDAKRDPEPAETRAGPLRAVIRLGRLWIQRRVAQLAREDDIRPGVVAPIVSARNTEQLAGACRPPRSS
jgi:hypothetical protein